MKKIVVLSLVAVSVIYTGCEQKKEQNVQKPVEQKSEQIVQESKNKEQIEQAKIKNEEQTVQQTAKEENQAQEKPQKQQVVQETTKEKKANEPSVSGETIFKSKGCTVCHHPEIDTTGPSLKKISKFYSGKKDKLIAFLKGQGDPIVDPAKFTIMKPQINITKNLSDEELSALADYMLSF